MYGAERYKELKQHLRIDKLRLDDELMECPVYLQAASEYAVEAMGLRDVAKHELDVATANEARLMRIADDKISEAKITNQMPLRPKVQEAQRKLDDCKLDAGHWSALAESMREKASLLRRMAELIVSGYLTQTSAYDERREEMAEARKFRRR